MVQNGIDRIDNFSCYFNNRRLGFITSVSGVDMRLNSSINILHSKYNLTALFAPEHGVRGNHNAGEIHVSYTDSVTGLPVYSLYRKDSKRLSGDMLQNIDTMVYDIQDMGTRYYTFISTLLYTAEDCAKYGKELIVLDRFNPLGDEVEGNILDSEYKSFVGAYPITIRYGLTAGEIAKMFVKENNIDIDLKVIPCKGWNRKQKFHETGNYWMMPSPGIPRFDTALLYPGTCLFEGTNVSEGRGTSCPFEIIGADYINAQLLSDRMNKKDLEGVIFTPAYFKPTASKHAGEACGGVHIHITDYQNIEPVTVGIELLYEIKELYPKHFKFLPPVKEFGKPFISLLSGDNKIVNNVLKNDLLNQFKEDSRIFKERKKEFEIY